MLNDYIDLWHSIKARLRNEPVLVRTFGLPLITALVGIAAKYGFNVGVDPQLILLAVMAFLGVGAASARGTVSTSATVCRATDDAHDAGWTAGWDWAETTRHSNEPENGPAPEIARCP